MNNEELAKELAKIAVAFCGDYDTDKQIGRWAVKFEPALAPVFETMREMRDGLEIITCEWVGIGMCPKCGREHGGVFPKDEQTMLREFATSLIASANKHLEPQTETIQEVVTQKGTWQDVGTAHMRMPDGATLESVGVTYIDLDEPLVCKSGVRYRIQEFVPEEPSND